MAEPTSLTPSPPKPGEPVVRSLEASATTTDGVTFARNYASGQAAFLPDLAAKVMAGARSFAPVSDHVARVLAPYQGMARFRLWQDAVRHQLETGGGIEFAGLLQRTGEAVVASLVQQGYLQTAEGVAASLDAALGPPAPPAAITTVGIPTANRPEILQRALESYLPHFKAHQRTPRILVSDDSRDPAVGEKNRAVCTAAAEKHGAKVEYLGMAERRALIEKHADGSAERKKALEFLLVDGDGLGQTFGMTRNALLLASQGELLFCADDDTLCRLLASSHQRPGLECLEPTGGPTYTREVATHAEAVAALRPLERDLLACHEQYLGRPLAAPLREQLLQPGFTMGELSPRAARRLLRGKDRVALTATGLAGHTGSTVELALMLAGLGADELRAGWGDHARLTQRLEARTAVKATDWAKATRDANFMSTFYGHDNRSWTVPFLPFLRGEDQLFKEMLIRVDPGAEVVYLPVALEHLPVATARPTPTPLSLFDMVLAALGEIPKPGEGAVVKDRVRELGGALVAFADQPLPRFRRAAFEVAALFALKDLARLRTLQREHGAAMPAPIAEVVSAAAQRLEAFLLAKDFVAAEPAWVAKLGSPVAAEEMARKVIRGMGEATAALANGPPRH